MRRPLSLIAFTAGALLLYSGYQRQQSIAGKLDSSSASIGEAIDGRIRIPLHVWYFLGGGLLGLAGVAVLIARRSNPAKP